MREVFFQATGLVTQPNEIGVYPPGAMKVAEGLVARSPGELQTRQNSVSYGAVTVTGNQRPYVMVWTGSQIMYVTQDTVAPSTGTLGWRSTGGNSVSPTFHPDSIHIQAGTDGWADFAFFKDRMFMVTETDVVVFDYMNPVSSAQRTARFAGLPQPVVSAERDIAGGAGQALGLESIVCYTAIFKRVYSGGYELISPPGTFTRCSNPSVTTIYNGSVSVRRQDGKLFGDAASAGGLMVGDLIEVYRTQSVDNPNTPDATEADPGTAAYLVYSYTIASADLSSSLKTLTDTARDGHVGEGFGGLGRALYTNPGQVGLEGVNTPPPAAKRIAQYKGRMFYANYQTPGDVTIAFRGGLGNLDNAGPSAIKSGIGARFASATSTNGSPTLTGIAAADLVGVVPGQLINGIGVLGNYITAVGASTITLTSNATASGTVPFRIDDVIEYIAGYTPAPPVRVVNLINVPAWYAASARTRHEDGVYIAYDQAYYLTNLQQPSTSLTLRATNGQNYDPRLPLITQVSGGTALVTAGQTPLSFPPRTFKNGLRWSKDQQPEHVPPSNEIFIGNGEIYGMYSTRDALWIFASDGLWRLSGSIVRAGQQVDIRVDPVDSTLILAGPRAGCVLRDSVYAFTNRGLIRVDDNGIVLLSEQIVGDIIPSRTWDPRVLTILCADEDNDDIYITLRTAIAAGASTSETFVYSTVFNVFTSTSTAAQPWTDLSAFAYGRNTRTVYAWDNNQFVDKITNTGAVDYQFARVDFQPLMADQPWTAKQWIDATLVLDIANTSHTVNPRWDSVANTTGPNLPRASVSSVDSRINYGVPRSNAIGNSLVFGFQNLTGQTNALVIKGVGVRFEYLTDQQVMR